MFEVEELFIGAMVFVQIIIGCINARYKSKIELNQHENTNL
jgi:hypothetical protein